MSEEVCLNPSLLCNPTHHIFMGNYSDKYQNFSLFLISLNFHLCNGTSVNSFFSKSPVKHYDHKIRSSIVCKKTLVSKRFYFYKA